METTILGNFPCINQSECIIVSSFQNTPEFSDNSLGNPTRGPSMYRRKRNRRGSSPKHEERGEGGNTHSLMLACLGGIEDCHSCSGLCESFKHHKHSSIAFTKLLEFCLGGRIITCRREQRRRRKGRGGFSPCASGARSCPAQPGKPASRAPRTSGLLAMGFSLLFLAMHYFAANWL
jgi:hypothetical protein